METNVLLKMQDLFPRREKPKHPELFYNDFFDLLISLLKPEKVNNKYLWRWGPGALFDESENLPAQPQTLRFGIMRSLQEWGLRQNQREKHLHSGLRLQGAKSDQSF